MQPSLDPRSPGIVSIRLFLGIGIILLGVLFLLDNVFPRNAFMAYWPAILVVIGAAKLVEARGRNTLGLVLVGVGGFLLLDALHTRFHYLEKLTWPLILVTGGILVVLHALRHQRARDHATAEQTASYIRNTTILGGTKHRMVSRSFRGGELTAIFGGFDLDLRQVAMAQDLARIDVFLLFGGGQLRVPEGWDVDVQVSGIAGGIGNKTTPPADPQAVHPRLLITGMALFGGMEVKH